MKMKNFPVDESPWQPISVKIKPDTKETKQRALRQLFFIKVVNRNNL